MMNHRQNNPALFRPTTTNSQGRAEMETGTRRKPAAIGGAAAAECKRNSRRALGVINQNLVGSSTTNQTGYPCVVTKRALTQECVIYDENSGYPVKRPITRKFAAQVQHNQLNQQIPPQPQKENKKPDDDVVVIEMPIQNSKKVEDTKIIDVNEEEEDSDSTSSTDLQPMPMSPETALGGGGAGDTKMEEVEMEDIFEEAVLDIDGCDAKNPLAVADYVVDLYTYYRKMEQGCNLVSPDYMSNQFDINHKMRAILIDWLIEVHYKFELRDETLFLTVNLIDRFLARQSVLRKKLQLVGLVALLLACKYEEVSVPVVEDLIFISDKAYSRKDILDMEKLMVNTLQFNLSLPTPYVFMTRFLKAAESDKKLELLSFFLIELALVEYEMLRFSPSLLAASAVYTAQCAVYGFKQWNKTCEWYSTYSEDQLMECSRLIVGLHETAATGKLTGVHRKYSTSKFGHAAKFSPPLFLLEETEET